MKLTCSIDKIKNYLSILERISSKNINLPILSNILLEANDSNLKISATDLEVALEINISCRVEKPGRVVISANTFNNFISNLPNININLESVGKNLQVICENFQVLINGQEVEDFPVFPKINKEEFSEINFTQFKNSLLKLINIVPLNNIRPEILGIYIKPDGDNLRLVATDGFRLGEEVINQRIKKNEPFILPLKTVQELIKIFEKENLVNLSYNKNQIGFFNEKIIFISRLIDGEYLNYQSIIPKKFQTHFYLNKDDLIKLIKVVSPFSLKGGEISLKIDKKFLEISSVNTEKGECFSKLDIQLEGEPLSLILNYKFFLDGLNNINNKKIYLGFNSSITPVILKSDEESYFYIIMPIKGY